VAACCPVAVANFEAGVRRACWLCGPTKASYATFFNLVVISAVSSLKKSNPKIMAAKKVAIMELR
jgi:hypothetical protein